MRIAIGAKIRAGNLGNPHDHHGCIWSAATAAHRVHPFGQEDWDHRVGIPTRSRSGDSPAALIRCAPGIAHLVLKMLCVKYGSR